MPAKNVVGEVGKGYKIAIEILNEGRIGIAAQMLGLAQGAFDYAVTYAFQRKQFGKAIGDNQGCVSRVVRVRIVAMRTDGLIVLPMGFTVVVEWDSNSPKLLPRSRRRGC